MKKGRITVAALVIAALLITLIPCSHCGEPNLEAQKMQEA